MWAHSKENGGCRCVGAIVQAKTHSGEKIEEYKAAIGICKILCFFVLQKGKKGLM